MLALRHAASGFAREVKTPISVLGTVAAAWATLRLGGQGGQWCECALASWMGVFISRAGLDFYALHMNQIQRRNVQCTALRFKVRV